MCRILGLLALLLCGVAQAQMLPSVTINLSKPMTPMEKADVVDALSKPILLPDITPPAPEPVWKSQVVATIFWVGEPPSKNNPATNVRSSWDPSWMDNFGGFDDPAPSSRAEDRYGPAKFVPKQNPFYVALPYNDVVNSSETKSEAAQVVPWFKSAYQRPGQSVCRDHWVAIRFGDRVCYAQWSDCGPFVTNDADYVFGNAQPTNQNNGGAGLDLSPAVRDYLGFASGQRCDWRFVDVSEVPDGPWRDWGTNNPFVNPSVRMATPTMMNDAVFRPNTEAPAHRAAAHTVAMKTSSAKGKGKHSSQGRLTELRRQRDAWLAKG